MPPAENPSAHTAKAALLKTVEGAAARYSQFVLHHRIAVIAATLIIAALLSTGMFRIYFAADARVFFGENNPERIALDELENTYTRSNGLLFILTPKDGTVFTKKNLSSLAEMTERAWQLPYTLAVNSLTNFNHTTANDDDIIVEPIYSADAVKTSEDVERIRRVTFDEPEIVNRLISQQGDVAGIAVRTVLPKNDKTAVPLTAKAAQDMLAQWRNEWQDFEVRLTGGVIADNTFAQAGRRDKNTLIPIMVVIIIAVLFVFLRSLSIALSIMTIVAMAVIAAFGTAGWLGFVMNAATGSSPIAIMVVVVASSVHLALTFLQQGNNGTSSKDAVKNALALNFAPISVTNITTAIGFLCMNFSDSPPLRDMGNIVAAGTLFGWVFTLSTLPALLSFLRQRRSLHRDWTDRAMRFLAEFTLRRSKALIVIFAVLLPVCAVGILRIEFDDDYIRYFDESFEFRRHTEYAENHLTGLNVVQFSLKSGEGGAVFDPEFLRKTDRFVHWLESHANVVFVDSPTKLFKRLNRTVNGDDPAFYTIADTRPENAQNLLVYELGLPVGHDLNNLIDIDRSSTKVSAVVRDVSSKDIRLLGLSAQRWLEQNTPEIATAATGLSIVFAYISERNINSMFFGTLLALVLISLILLPAFQSVRFGLVSLIPNLVPALIAFGIWGFVIGQVNLAASVVCSMTLGIVVDDTVHIMMKYIRARRIEGCTAEMAIRRVMPTVGLALVITSITLGLGFAIIATSSFQLSQHLGSLTTIVITAALIADFFLLLPLLVIFDRYLK